MKVFVRIVPVFCLLIFGYNLCRSQDDGPINIELNAECTIPNQQKTKGICVQRQNCEEYDALFNVTDLTVERLSFIVNLHCGFDYVIWKSLVCCPQTGKTYKYDLRAVTLTK